MTIDFKVGKPKEFSTKETEDFLRLLIQQNQIKNPSIEKVSNCALLCFAYYQNELIGIGAIKQVYKTPFDKAGVSELKDNYNNELGYLFIKEDKEIRGKGIAKAICKFLISKVSEKNIFATTEQSEENSMTYILQGLNFEKVGETYTGAKTKKTIGLYILEGTKTIDLIFDDLLTQIIKGNLSHDDLASKVRYEEFQQVSQWKLKYGYKFNIYSNDHLIDGKKHFHFDNKAQNICTKLDFQCNVLEIKGSKPIPANVFKELKYFVAKENIQSILHKLWNDQNPTLTHGM